MFIASLLLLLAFEGFLLGTAISFTSYNKKNKIHNNNYAEYTLKEMGIDCQEPLLNFALRASSTRGGTIFEIFPPK